MRNTTRRFRFGVFLVVSTLSVSLTLAGCSSPLTTREKGGLIGGALGAGSGAIIGSAVGHAAAGALIGGPIGLIGGALVGDQLISHEHTMARQQRQIEQNRAELDRQRREFEVLKSQE